MVPQKYVHSTELSNTDLPKATKRFYGCQIEPRGVKRRPEDKPRPIPSATNPDSQTEASEAASGGLSNAEGGRLSSPSHSSFLSNVGSIHFPPCVSSVRRLCTHKSSPVVDLSSISCGLSATVCLVEEESCQHFNKSG